VAAKAGPVPTHERLGPDDCENLQDKRKPAIQLDQEPAITVRKPDATRQPTPHDIQLMSKHRVLSFKPQLRLEWRPQDGQNETEQPDHSASIGDSITASTRIRFSVHTAVRRDSNSSRASALRSVLRSVCIASDCTVAKRILDTVVELVDEKLALLVGLEPVGDVGIGAEPANDPAVSVADRQRARQEPAILSNRESVFPGLTAHEAHLDLRQHLVRMVGMDRDPPAAGRHVGQTCPGVVEPALVEPVGQAFRIDHPGELTHVICQRAEFGFAFRKLRLAHHAIRDVIPFDENAAHDALLIDNWLVDEIEITLLESPVAVQLDRAAAPLNRLSAKDYRFKGSSLPSFGSEFSVHTVERRYRAG
jgi:hypothetical protein